MIFLSQIRRDLAIFGLCLTIGGNRNIIFKDF